MSQHVSANESCHSLNPTNKTFDLNLDSLSQRRMFALVRKQLEVHLSLFYWVALHGHFTGCQS
jgi:hypothetical protein